ncbi:MAG TPA: carboxypeptidase-like regulatory domain-containing protein [Acidobacteriaceae bacterium]|jgi:hypothetical protein|nr:carboxypeptidase-like regulatory domain-containing protein [Acidobacteriaceae bacterium]
MPRRWLLLLLPLVAAAQNGSPVAGQLVNKITRAGIAGAKVMVSAAQVQLTYETYTDPAGRFYIPLVAPGDYSISFDTRDYLPLPISDPASRPFHVADMTAPVHFQEEFTPYGTLTGRVVDGEGRPASGLQIETLRARGGGLSVTLTDGDGKFYVRSLMPGAYVLLARPMLPGSGGTEQQHFNLPLPTAAEGERLTWAATYYPNATERSGAQIIMIHGGSNLTAYDIRLRSAPLWRVRGVVLDELGKPAAGADVTLHSAEPLTEPEARAQSAADGSFELPAVCPGDWRIFADVKRGTVVWRGSAPVSVARRDVEQVTVRLAPPFTMEGFVERDDPLNAYGQRAPVTIQLASASGAPDVRASADERPDGSLRIANVYAGRYRIQALGQIQGHYLESVRLGVADVTGQAVELAAGGPAVRVVYRGGAGRAVGLVENGWGSTVALAPKDETLLGLPFVRTAPAGMDGRFDLGNLRPGDYYVWAFDRADLNSLMDADFVRNLIPLAESVHVLQGQVVVTPNLNVQPWPE